MSTTTDVLSLFKYDPVADADSTFNITQALNNNWDKLDAAILLAIAAAAAYDPEGSYAVGDYCTHGGKLHKCSTPIPSGETWNAEHWTATTVAAELAEIETSLSNKLSVTDHGSNNISLLDTSLSDGIHICSNWADCPLGLTDTQGTCIATTFLRFGEPVKYWGYRIYLPINDGEIYINRCQNSVWDGWEPIATATPPEVRNLTLQSGFLADEGTCTFFKTQENVVFLAGGVTGTLPVHQLTQIGTLPANFCPFAPIRRDATTDAGTAFIEIHMDGTVWIYPFVTATKCWFSAPFEVAMKGEI